MSRRLVVLSIAAVVFVGPSVAAGAVSGPRWVRKPTGEDLGRVYPREAREKGIPGWAKMRCKVTAKGTLTGCETVEEYPQLMGFGAAALRLAPKFEMTSKSPDGQSVEGGSVEIPIRFQMTR
jgi:protein TonB